jgi:hypothetical protein
MPKICSQLWHGRESTYVSGLEAETGAEAETLCLPSFVATAVLSESADSRIFSKTVLDPLLKRRRCASGHLSLQEMTWHRVFGAGGVSRVVNWHRRVKW